MGGVVDTPDELCCHSEGAQHLGKMGWQPCDIPPSKTPSPGRTPCASRGYSQLAGKQHCRKEPTQRVLLDHKMTNGQQCALVAKQAQQSPALNQAERVEGRVPFFWALVRHLWGAGTKHRLLSIKEMWTYGASPERSRKMVNRVVQLSYKKDGVAQPGEEKEDVISCV